ncbi:hypothetical protein [Bremerella cremea]|nr:hypothetical protein [Bremerella cremea]
MGWQLPPAFASLEQTLRGGDQGRIGLVADGTEKSLQQTDSGG